MLRQNVADWICVTGLESHQRRVHNALIFATEFFADQSFQLIDVEIENLRDQPENENVLAFVLGRAAQRFDGQTSDGDADVHETFVVQIRLDVIGIVKQDAAGEREMGVVLITVLKKSDEKSGYITFRDTYTETEALVGKGGAD